MKTMGLARERLPDLLILSPFHGGTKVGWFPILCGQVYSLVVREISGLLVALMPYVWGCNIGYLPIRLLIVWQSG